jgi:hypothetical protein
MLSEASTPLRWSGLGDLLLGGAASELPIQSAREILLFKFIILLTAHGESTRIRRTLGGQQMPAPVYPKGRDRAVAKDPASLRGIQTFVLPRRSTTTIPRSPRQGASPMTSKPSSNAKILGLLAQAAQISANENPDSSMQAVAWLIRFLLLPDLSDQRKLRGSDPETRWFAGPWHR